MTAAPPGWSAAALAALGAETGVALLRDQDALAAAGVDFGHLRQGTPSAVAKPRAPHEIAAVLAFASRQRQPVTIRGRGFSQGGQSLAPPGGLTLDMSDLVAVGMVDPEEPSVTCEAGATWGAVIARTAPAGFLPCVLPLNLELTVGGVLSVGGIGATSHRFGPAVAQVPWVEAVSGDGRLIEGDRERGAPLLSATLAALGRCAVITRARIRLRRFQPRVRTFYLLYDAIDPWLDDQRALQDTGRADYLEGFCSASPQGLRNTPGGRVPFAQWFYGLHVSFEYGAAENAPTEHFLAGLCPYRVVHVEDNDTVAFTGRYASRFAFMRRTGAWAQAHPWVECFLSLGAAREVLPQVLEALPLFLGDGHRVMLIQDHELPRFLAMPAERPVVAFAVLPAGLAEPLREAGTSALRSLHETLVGAGGKRYLSGWLEPMDAAAWQAHLGPAHAEWLEAKAGFDPAGILQSSLFEGGPP